jgi:hypothetical protein
VVNAQLQIIPLPTNWVGHERAENGADELLWGFFGLGFKGFEGGEYRYLLKIFYFRLGDVLLYFQSSFQMPIWSLWVCELTTNFIINSYPFETPSLIADPNQATPKGVHLHHFQLSHGQPSHLLLWPHF